MAHCYIRDISESTGVSKRTLHHYDKIGLLTPTLRASNGYRVYSESDLLKLQRIIVLKYFGFELSKVKAILATDANMSEVLTKQLELVVEKNKVFNRISEILKEAILDYNLNSVIEWEDIIKKINIHESKI